MYLYLVQHGEAKKEEEDPRRPLTDKGREDVTKVARHIAEHARTGIKKIIHSGKLRAEQTAQIMASYLRPLEGVERAEGLDPLADPEIWSERLSGMGEDLMIVGHLPHLSNLASKLVCGRTDKKVVEFRMGGVVCLKRDDKEWSVCWILTPEVV